MKRTALALALVSLSVPAAAGAMQTSSQPATPSKASSSHIKVYGTVSAITRSTVKIVGAAKSLTFTRGAVSLTGIPVGAHVEAEGFVRQGVLRLSAIHLDNRAAQTVSSASSPAVQPVDDNGGRRSGQDDGPGHR